MGNRLNRSEEKKDKHRRRRRHDKVDEKFDGNTYLIRQANENESPNEDYNLQYDLWKNEYNPSQIHSMNDAPGAPSTYGTNDIMVQSWTAHSNMNNSFYPSFNVSYPSYPQTVVPLEARPSKKVQFSTVEHVDSSVVNRPKKPVTKTSSIPLPVEKPIYVGIDYQATLAERDQSIKRHRHTTEKQSSHRTRIHKQQLLTDSPQSSISLTKPKRKSSPVIPSRQKIEPKSSSTNDSKSTPHHHHHHHRRPQHTSSSTIHEDKPIKLHRQTQANQSIASHSSTKPRFEAKQTGSPVMRISLSQVNQHHSKQRVTRIRV